jgi:hypothetical protein
VGGSRSDGTSASSMAPDLLYHVTSAIKSSSLVLDHHHLSSLVLENPLEFLFKR